MMKKAGLTICLIGCCLIQFSYAQQKEEILNNKTPLVDATNSIKKEFETEQVDGLRVRVTKLSKPISTAFSGPEDSKAIACESIISSDYWQEDENLTVEALIENTQCGASQGQYTVKVRTANESGERQTTRYTESWSRDDDNAITAVHKYSMNGDTDLVRVNVSLSLNDSCVCRDSNDPEASQLKPQLK